MQKREVIYQRHGLLGGAEAVRVRLLGGFGVSVGERGIGAGRWRLRKAAGLVKLLALARGHALHREQVMDALWPELDAGAAANNLHRALHFARRALDPTGAIRYVTFGEDRLELCPVGGLWVDATVFEETAAAARRCQEPATYEAALALYAGDLLPGDRYEEWSQERRFGLRRLYLELLVELAGLREERGETGRAVEVLERAIGEEPAGETAHAALMRLYARKGRRSEAIQQYDRLRRATLRELGVEPGETARRLHERLRAGGPVTAPAPERSPPAPVPSSNLSLALTSFVGRDLEMIEVRRLLSMTRLLTLTGVGGSGKTRLALEVARDLTGTCADGVWMVELAPVPDAALVARSVAAALDIREQPGRPVEDTLVEHLRPRRILLLLDNCEHLVDAVAGLARDLLGACPNLKVLATSREVLGVPGETVWSVPPLSLPGADDGASPEGLIHWEAMRLFVERARSRVPDFELTRENAGAVTRACAKLDGIPLAIELATARLGALTVEQLADRLEGPPGLLAGGGRAIDPRQRTMTATLDWSYRLLSEDERSLLARLSVFAGGMTLEAVEAVCPTPVNDTVLDLVSRLVEKSLLIFERTAGGAARYRMLEPVRQYAAEKLRSGAKAEETRERHARHYLSLALESAPGLSGPDPIPSLTTLGMEIDNLRAALAWTLDETADKDRVETGLRLANALARFWDTHGPAESRRWLERGLARGVEVPPAVKVEALREAGFIAVYEWDPRSIEMLTEALELYRKLGDQRGILLTVENLGHALGHHATPEVAAPIVAEVEALLGGSGDRNVQAQLITFLGFAAEVESNHEQTRLRWKEALAIYREVGDTWNIARCLPSLGMITLACHDVEAAAGYFEEGLAMARDVRYKTVLFFHLMGLSAVAAHRGQALRAAKLYGAGERLRESEGFSLDTLSSSEYDYEGYLRMVRTTLDDGSFEAAWNQGRALSLQEAIEYALGREDTTVRASPALPAGGLTRREHDVAARIARGYTNRHISRELGISERTVETHVGSILRKLGLRSRTQIATRFLTRAGLHESDDRYPG